jgi:hypothetical protein
MKVKMLRSQVARCGVGGFQLRFMRIAIEEVKKAYGKGIKDLAQ